jgi:voltage-gated potassium channel
MNALASFRHLKIAILLVIGVLSLGTVGYILLEQFSFLDALYTTVGMMSTVGPIIHPLSQSGEAFSIIVIILGVASLLYTFGVGMEFMIEGHLSQVVRRHFMNNKISLLRNHYIICGFGRVGSQIADDLAAKHLPFVVIDELEPNIQKCIQCGYLALRGDATYDDLLRSTGILKARCLLAATDNDAHNISITLSARYLNSQLFIVARANRNETEAKLRLAGADRVLSPYMLAGHRMSNLALQPGIVEFFDTLTKAGGLELAVREVMIAAHSPLLGHTLTDAQHELKDDTIIVALRKRSGLLTGSRLEARIEAGDTIIVVGAPEQLSTFTRLHSLSENDKK